MSICSFFYLAEFDALLVPVWYLDREEGLSIFFEQIGHIIMILVPKDTHRIVILDSLLLVLADSVHLVLLDSIQ